MTRLVIAGGGLSACLAALALSRRRPEVELLLVEQDKAFGGNHVWSFFDTDLPDALRWVLDGVSVTHWPDHEIRFPYRHRVIPIGYNSLRSGDLDAAVRRALRPQQYRLGQRIAAVDECGLTLEGGERIAADAVVDARGPGPVPSLALGWQKFVGRTYAFDQPHGCKRPIIMDATVDQSNGYRFVYSLPFSETELLIEDTYYATSDALEVVALGRGLDEIAAGRGAGEARLLSEEQGVLPVVIGGPVDGFWDKGPAVPRLGLAGGFFHPTTGYSLPDAVRNAALLADEAELRTAPLHDLLHRRAKALWRERSFFQLLNRMLFHAADPADRYRVLEHFYRLPAPVIGRFYAARLTALDKLRILSGRPPVPIGRALSALGRKAA